jgi:hypothetical protein
MLRRLEALNPDSSFSPAVPTNSIPILLLAVDVLGKTVSASGKKPKQRPNNEEGLSLAAHSSIQM